MPFVDTDRLRIHYRTHGDPAGDPMLLLHGSFASSRWWEPFLALLPDDIYAVAPDLRGSGATDKPPDGYTISTLADDVAALVQRLGLRNFDLAGHASGGAVALEYALMQPAQVATLTLIAPAPVEGVVTPLEAIMLLEEMRTDGALLTAAIRAMLPAFDTENKSDNAAFLAQLVDDAAQQAPAAFTEIAVALAHWNRFAEAAELTLPTLLIWGDQDTIVDRAAMTRALLAIPGANNLEVLRGVGHAPMIEDPLRLAERIVNFVTEDYAGFADIRSSVDENDHIDLR